MELIPCSLCGAEYDGRRRFCPRCGEARGAPAGVQPEVASPRARQVRARALAVVALLAVSVVVAVIALPKRTLPVTPGRPAPARVERPAGPAEAPLPVVDPESIPPAERAFLDEVAVGQIAFNEGRFEDALAEFVGAFQQDADNAHAANAAGQTLVRMGRPADAVPYLESATRLAPDRADFHFNLARALGQGGRWQEAVGEYRQAANLRPDDYPSAFNLGQALERSGDDEAALGEYRRGAGLAPLEPSFRLAIATVAERLGRADDSRKALEDYLELVPEGGESDRVRQRLAKLSGGSGAADSTVAAATVTRR